MKNNAFSSHIHSVINRTLIKFMVGSIMNVRGGSVIDLCSEYIKIFHKNLSYSVYNNKKKKKTTRIIIIEILNCLLNKEKMKNEGYQLQIQSTSSDNLSCFLSFLYTYNDLLSNTTKATNKTVHV